MINVCEHFVLGVMQTCVHLVDEYFFWYSLVFTCRIIVSDSIQPRTSPPTFATQASLVTIPAAGLLDLLRTAQVYLLTDHPDELGRIVEATRFYVDASSGQGNALFGQRLYFFEGQADM